MMLPATDADSLALLYHLNSEPWMVDDFDPDAALPASWPGPRPRRTAPESIVGLPPNEPVGVAGLALSRASCRAYAALPLPLEHVARMAHCAYGRGRVRTWAAGSSFVARSVPSAGGLYALELDLALQHIDGLDDGLYLYDGKQHQLALQQSGLAPPQFAPHLLGQDFAAHANGLLLIAADFGPTLAKYGPRGYRYLLLEAAHVAQNFCLAATELELGSICLGGFHDGAVNALLGIDGRRQAVLYAVAFGHPS